MADQLRQLTEGLGASFSTLERRSSAMMELTARVRTALLGDEKEHVVSASYRGSTLIVIADSAAWCTHIRYAQQRLLEQVSGPDNIPFTKVRVKVGQPTGGHATDESVRS